MIVLMLGIGNGLQSGVLSQFSGTATNSFYVWNSRTSMPYGGMKPGRFIQMRYSDIKYLQDNLEELEYVVPMSQLGGYRGQNEVVYKNRTANFGVVGATPEIQHIQLVNTLNGRFLKQSDLTEKRKVAVCGSAVERILFGDESAVGKSIKINEVYFLIVGVYKSVKSDDRAVEEENRLYIPFDTYLHAFNFGESVGWRRASAICPTPSSASPGRSSTRASPASYSAPTTRRAAASSMARRCSVGRPAATGRRSSAASRKRRRRGS